MSWKQWTAVAALIGGGVVLQVSGHREVDMGGDHSARGAMEMAAPTNTPSDLRTVALDVTGMT